MGGRLSFPGEQSGWVTRATVDALKTMEAVIPGKVMTLTLPDSRTFEVIFDRSNGAAVEAQQLLPTAYPDAGYIYTLTLRLFTVAS